jgi:hypothetical protein
MKTEPRMARGMTQFVLHLERYVQATNALTDAVARQNKAVGEILGTTTNVVSALDHFSRNKSLPESGLTQGRPAKPFRH